MSERIDASEEGWSLREYADVLWRGRRLILAASFLALIPALVLALIADPAYEAEVRVLVLPVDTGDAETPATPPNLETERQILASEQTADRVREDLNLSLSSAELTGSLNVSVVPGTEVLELAFRDDDAELVDDIANSFAQEYLEMRRQRAAEAREVAEDPSQTAESRLRLLRARAQKLEEQIEGAQGRALRANDRAEVRTYVVVLEHLLSQRASLSEQIIELREELIEAGEAGVSADQPAPEAGRIVDPADTPATPVSPQPVRNGLFALAAGAAIGIVIVLLLHAMRTPANRV